MNASSNSHDLPIGWQVLLSVVFLLHTAFCLWAAWEIVSLWIEGLAAAVALAAVFFLPLRTLLPLLGMAGAITVWKWPWCGSGLFAGMDSSFRLPADAGLAFPEDQAGLTFAMSLQIDEIL